MSQSREASALEAAANVLVGYVLAILGQLAIFPVYGLAVTLPQSLGIGAIFTGLSMARSYMLRRFCDRMGAE